MKPSKYPALHRSLFILAVTILIIAVFRFPKIKYGAESIVFFTADPLLNIFFRQPSPEVAKQNFNAKSLTFNAPGIYAPVIKVPPAISFGNLIIAAGRREGVETGMKAVFDGGIFVGFVEEVFENYSRIRMISRFGDFEQVRVGGISALNIEGLGGTLAKIELPKAVNLSVGDPVLIYAGSIYLAGFVESVDLDDAKSLLEAKVVLPFNAYELKYVSIIP